MFVVSVDCQPKLFWPNSHKWNTLDSYHTENYIYKHIKTMKSNSSPHPQRFSTFILTTLIVGFLFSPFSLYSQESDQETNENDIIELDPFTVETSGDVGYQASNSVSGTRVNVALENVPMAIQVITQELIEDIEAINLEEVTRYASSVRLADQGSTGASQGFNIRGFVNRRTLRNGFSTPAFTNMANVQRIEVVKGPASTLYGQSSPGGIINLITKKPIFTETPIANVHLAVGSNNYYNALVDVTSQLGNSSNFAYRVVAGKHAKRYAQPYSKLDRIQVAPSLTFRFKDRITIDLEYEHLSDNTVPRSDTPIGFLTDANGDIITVPDQVTNGNGELVDAGSAGRGLTFYDKSFGREFGIEGNEAFDDNITNRATVDAKIKISDFLTYRFNGSFLENSRKENSIEDVNVFSRTVDRIAARPEVGYGRGLRLFFRDDDFNERIIRNEVLADFDFGDDQHNFKALIGLENSSSDFITLTYQASDNDGGPDSPLIAGVVQEHFTSSPTGDFVNFVTFAEDPLLYTGRPGFSNQTTSQDIDAFYANFMVSLFNDRLNLTGGFRDDDFKSQSLNLINGSTDSLTTSATTKQFGAVFKINKNLSVYGSFSSSFIPNQGLDIDDRQLAPESGEGTDFGIKFKLFNNKVAGTISYFDLERQNIKSTIAVFVRDPITGDFVFCCNENVLSGLESSEGVDFDLILNPTPRWQILLGGAFTDAVVVEDERGPENEGFRTNGASRLTGHIWTRYTMPEESQLSGFSIGGGISYESEAALRPRFDRRNRKSDSNALIDLFVGYKAKLFDRDVKFEINVKNLADREFVTRNKVWSEERRIIFSATFDL